MEITILLDNDLSGNGVFIEQVLKETGWDQLIQVRFRQLRDYGLPYNLPDREVWRFVQTHHLLLVTNNRNSEDDSSLQATMRRENTLTCWPIVTISDKDALVQTDYRQRVAHRLAAIIVDLENYPGAGRVFAP
ncbi:MAG TPA: ACP S-malonyltransferase [Blastocatellia bacterium]|nr:ACP S-malonyltransferase [Blastocatellia bacterium]HMV85216.1 ACP S-malonyltransferase [Blastocatellia bacterium]HMX24578.1 ACP S-malonyltransferase [Blastocatellia bacterium]HMY72803.1 ACP S-malonyltransferase [Blastocatellia bacterium]HMZ18331.1 ACP S-malonyltransferase [Blastocatellia bacterium]